MHNPIISPAQFAASVIAVPPLARGADYSLNSEGNRQILAHLAAGGVSTALYGGNANFYNMAVSEFAAILDMLENVAPDGTWIIPSIGADFGKASDQVQILKDRAFPTAMLLPLAFPSTSSGVATGLRKLADQYGRPLISYIKSLNYVEVADLARLVSDGVICAVKYAVVTENPESDPYLSALVDSIDKSLVVSGIGERPAIAHLSKFGLNGFTSGSVCIAPALSMALLSSLKANRPDEAAQIQERFLPLEDLRDFHSPLRVLHAAVAQAGIADTGPLLPFLSNIEDPELIRRVGEVALELVTRDRVYRQGGLRAALG